MLSRVASHLYWLSRYLERAEPRCNALYEEITTRGDRLLAQLREQNEDPASAAK